MLLHLEAGTCVSGVTRRIVDNTVREWDRNNLITDPRRMIAGPSSSFSNTLDTTTTYYATAAAWNGSRYECYLCHSGFTTLHGLNQHLASPRHQQGVYVCPQATCRASFKTLSGLCQHVESERCGVHRFREVRGAMDVIVGRVGLLGIAALLAN
ncbi:hypothetical protein H0H92_008267 [Tricholoma furcatifolium]|nr:hypothetical protein H0H92_008267 [Tricholoma furcatifolium]